jgi:hypothetical protein
MLNVHAPPLAAASAALAEHAALQTAAEGRAERANANGGNATVSIDRAIAGVFLMLIVMVLRKFYFSTGQPQDGWVGSSPGGGMHMEREM